MSTRRCAGSATIGAILLLLAIAGAGVWNYNRNLEIERSFGSTRPYQGYATQDLEALRSAYASELESVRTNLVHTKSRREEVKRDGSVAANVEQFAKTAVKSAAIREAAGNVADREGQIGELDTELDLRHRFGQGKTRHLKLLLKIDDLFSS